MHKSTRAQGQSTFAGPGCSFVGFTIFFNVYPKCNQSNHGALTL